MRPRKTLARKKLDWMDEVGIWLVAIFFFLLFFAFEVLYAIAMWIEGKWWNSSASSGRENQRKSPETASIKGNPNMPRAIVLPVRRPGNIPPQN